MPGFTIHIAVAKEYERKHKKDIKNKKEFLKGTIDPDYISLTNPKENKNKTHYGEWGNWKIKTPSIHINEFLKDPRVQLNNDYWKGYFLHLLADYYFFGKYFYKEIILAKENNDKFYNDYDCLNKALIEKYDIEILETIKKYMSCLDEEPKYLDIDRVIKFIEDISNLDLEEQSKKFRDKS